MSSEFKLVENEMLFKIINENGTPCHGGWGKWSLPHNKQPGDWMPPVKGKLIACENGYHLCREGDLIKWLGPAIFEAEYRGERLDTGNKIVVRQARLLRRLNWDERIARHFACDCAEEVLHLYEQKYPDDLRPRQAIEVARRYADGEVTDGDLNAARIAAWNAARTAASVACSGAARTAGYVAAWDAASAAASTTARDVTPGDAARNAAWAIGRDAAIQQQTKRLMQILMSEHH